MLKLIAIFCCIIGNGIRLYELTHMLISPVGRVKSYLQSDENHNIPQHHL